MVGPDQFVWQRLSKWLLEKTGRPSFGPPCKENGGHLLSDVRIQSSPMLTKFVAKSPIVKACAYNVDKEKLYIT